MRAGRLHRLGAGQRTYTYSPAEDPADAVIKALREESTATRYLIDALIWANKSSEDVIDSLLDAGIERSGFGSAAPVLMGQAGERRVREKYDIGPRERYRINDHNRISDGTKRTTITEVKNVKCLWYSHQLQDAWEHAQEDGKDFDLYVRGGDDPTVLPKGLKQMEQDNPRFHIKEIP